MRIASTLIAVLLLLTPAPSAGQETALERYVRMGLEANHRLDQQEIAARQARARWEESRSSYLPSLGLEARYSRAEGGRTFDVPVGDLLNPVYSTLDDLTGSSRFPTVENQRFHLLREREQYTQVRISQVLWNPALNADVRSKRYQADAARAGTEAARRALVRDIRVAYYEYANATRAVSILDDALETVRENERSTQALWETSLSTRDEVHRARAETLEIEARRARAEADRELAAARLNYLLGRDSDADVELDPRDLALPTEGRMASLRRLATDGAAGLDRLEARAADGRAELEQLDRAVSAADAGVRAARTADWPSVALALDLGIQGREYGFSGDHRFLQASVVLSWNFLDGGAEGARVRQATLERERLESQRDDAAARIRLELEAAVRNARVALANLTTASERVREAEEAFRLVERRRQEGAATALEYRDARASLTRARMSQNISETDALVRLAELDHAIGTPDGAPRRIADDSPEEE